MLYKNLLLGSRNFGFLFAVFQPHIINRVFDSIKTGTIRKHPASEYAFDFFIKSDFVNLDKSICSCRFIRRACIAYPWRYLKSAKLVGLSYIDIESCNAAGNFIETGEHSNGIT